AASRLNSAENVRRCLLIRHLSHGEDSRLNRCPGSVDHYSLGSVLNADDSILPLLDAPPGRAFERLADGSFIEVQGPEG
ncbi:immunity protein Imm33 domain-containing protein, partial [Pseudomonas aeruginosa]|uniref:immunity protein Imm33 domain-containing protein n=1 Tax=Pseudomonas aeruginosa TaxID=287 RepID=UPI001161471E